MSFFLIKKIFLNFLFYIGENLTAGQETWVQSLGWEDPLEEDMATPPIFLPKKSPGQRSLAGYSPWSHIRIGYNLATKQKQLINNVVIVLGGQQRDSSIRIHVSILPTNSLSPDCHIILSRVSCAIQQDFVLPHISDLIFEKN